MKLSDSVTGEGSILEDLYNFLADPGNKWYKFSLTNIVRKVGINPHSLTIIVKKYEDIKLFTVDGISYLCLTDRLPNIGYA